MLSDHCLVWYMEMNKQSDFIWTGKMAGDLREQQLIVSGIV